MKNKHELVWENCLKIIKDNINVQSYKTWFEPIKPVKLDEKNLTIQVPSQFFYEWLEEHYVTLLRKTIKRELGEDAKLEYRILVDSSNGAKTEPKTIDVPNYREGVYGTAIKNRRMLARLFRQQQHARHRCARAIVELKFLQPIITAIFARERFDFRNHGSRGQAAEQAPQLHTDVEPL